SPLDPPKGRNSPLDPPKGTVTTTQGPSGHSTVSWPTDTRARESSFRDSFAGSHVDESVDKRPAGDRYLDASDDPYLDASYTGDSRDDGHHLEDDRLGDPGDDGPGDNDPSDNDPIDN